MRMVQNSVSSNEKRLKDVSSLEWDNEILLLVSGNVENYFFPPKGSGL